VYVADSPSGRVLRLSPQGQVIGVWDRAALGLEWPSGIWVDPAGDVILADGETGRVVVVRADVGA
jgi:hypothetical protein